MTTPQLYFFNALALGALIVVAILTRATARRIAGAIAGGLAVGVVHLGIIALGEKIGLWHIAITWKPYFLTLLLLCMALSSFIYLITWRVARCWGWRGLAVAVIVAAIIGPPRSYWYMATFPKWGAYAPGIAPVLVISAMYALMIVLGHGVMRLISGPANADPLARRPWEPKAANAP